MEHKLGVNKNRSCLPKGSGDTFGGFIVDWIMLSSLGLEVMNSTNPELNWKIVTKGRRSRKSVARSLNGGVKVGKSISPKRVGDFSGSDYDKVNCGRLIIIVCLTRKN